MRPGKKQDKQEIAKWDLCWTRVPFVVSTNKQSRQKNNNESEILCCTLASFMVSTVVKHTRENLPLHTWVPHTDDVLAALVLVFLLLLRIVHLS